MFKSTGRAAATAAVLCAALTLGGCSRSISVVKDSDAPNSGFKIGQVLDHKKNCSSSSWSQSKDDNDRPVVEFRCDLHISDATVSTFGEKALANVRFQVQQRISGGPETVPVAGLPGGHGDDTVAGRRKDVRALDEGSDDAKEIADDPTGAMQMADLRQQWKAAEAQVEAIDSECRKLLPRMQADREAVVMKVLQAHRDFVETIHFILKNGQIVERRLNIATPDGADLQFPPSALYALMLEPNPKPDQEGNEERVILHEAVKLPTEDLDFKYCGHREKYQPVSERFEAIESSVDPIWKAFRERQRLEVHALPSSR